MNSQHNNETRSIDSESISVLLVEDSESVVLQIELFLKAASGSFDLARASNLTDGIKLVQSTKFDVILLDLGLPDSDGLDTLNKMHAVAAEVPTVVFTGVTDEDLSLEALRRGAQDFLVKSQVNGGLITRAIRYAIERKQAEVALRESEKKHRTLLEAMPDIVYKIDRDGHFKYVNSAVACLGYTPDELLGKHFSIIIHPDDVDRIFRISIIPEVVSQITGPPKNRKAPRADRSDTLLTKDLIMKLVHKDWRMGDEAELVIGSLTSYGESTAPGTDLSDSQDTPNKSAGTVGIIKDITERTRSEEEKMVLETQLQQSQKMEAIGRLAGGVAHDMNNVLGAILGSASVLELEVTEDDPKKSDVENILVACRKGRDLTRDLLGFARKGKYVRESIFLNEVVLEAKALLSRTIAKKITVETDLEEHLDATEGDRSQIHHALMNVCINAADAMEGPSRLTMTTRNVTIDEVEVVKYGGIRPGQYVELTVIDTGFGMDPETLQMVFEPFFTTKPEGEGTGLGLSMVYGVVKNHGGTVTIESERGIGTTVVFLLPARSRRVERDSDQVIAKPSSKPDRGGILLVDDEQIIRNSARRLLEKLGYTVFLADNGSTAINVYNENKSDISLVILDLIMPEMDGPETFEALVKLDADVKVLILSGYSSHDDKVENMLKHGALGFVQKPFDLRTLSEAVKTAFV